MATFIVGIIIAAVAVLIIRKMVLDKKNGRTCCSGSCGSCSKGCK